MCLMTTSVGLGRKCRQGIINGLERHMGGVRYTCSAIFAVVTHFILLGVDPVCTGEATITSVAFNSWRCIPTISEKATVVEIWPEAQRSAEAAATCFARPLRTTLPVYLVHKESMRVGEFTLVFHILQRKHAPFLRTAATSLR